MVLNTLTHQTNDLPQFPDIVTRALEQEGPLDDETLHAVSVHGFRSRPADFARNYLGINLWAKQEDVLNALAQHRRVAVKAGNGLGKGFTAAAAVLWFLSAYAPATVLTTAPTARQVRHVLWREIRRLYAACPHTIGGHMLSTRLDLTEDRFALGLTSDEADQFQGFHCPNMLIVVDEAEGVSEGIYEAIDAVMTASNCKLLLIGNPTTDSGTFRRAFHEDRRIFHNITISALESPNVEQKRVVIPGLTTHEWVEERASIWGESSPMYQARVLGQFSDCPEDALIPLSKIEQAIARNRSGHVTGSEEADDDGTEAATVLAVDVARFGTDKSVLLLADSEAVLHMESHRGLDTMELTGRVVDAYRRWSPKRIAVDEVGIGAGVVDRLKELNLPVTGVNVGRQARQRRIFANLRSEGYWRLHELFNQDAIAIPDDAELAGQLASLRHRYNSKGQLFMETKEEARARGIPSPDKADALMLAFLSYSSGVRLYV